MSDDEDGDLRSMADAERARRARGEKPRIELMEDKGKMPDDEGSSQATWGPGIATSDAVALPTLPPRPCVVLDDIEAPMLLTSLEDAVAQLGAATGSQFTTLFVNGHGMRGVWVIPHPDRPPPPPPVPARLPLSIREVLGKLSHDDSMRIEKFIAAGDRTDALHARGSEHRRIKAEVRWSEEHRRAEKAEADVERMEDVAAERENERLSFARVLVTAEAERDHLRLFGVEAHEAGIQWTKRALKVEAERDLLRELVKAVTTYSHNTGLCLFCSFGTGEGIRPHTEGCAFLAYTRAARA